MSEPYPNRTDEELDEVIADWLAETEPAEMVVTDLGAWESVEYEAWCQERDRTERENAA